jgi:hypothetical protein
MKRAIALILAGPALFGCSSTVNVDRDAARGSQAGGSAGTTVDGGNGSGGGTALGDASSIHATSGGAGGGAPVDAAVTRDGMVCEPMHPTTPTGTCPVTPPGGILCSPAPANTPNCGNRGECGYASAGTDIPDRICRRVCADAMGNCPPAESVCTQVQSCSSDQDCKGSPPQTDCVSCPLSPDGKSSVACRHWICASGTCQVGYCDDRGALSCSGGHGCPSYDFPAFDKTCNQDADCTVFSHFESCCSTRVIGVSARDQARISAVETECTALLDMFQIICGCEPFVKAEDGTSMPQLGQQIVGACVSGACQGVVRGRITCGSTSCAETESCCTIADANGHCTSGCAPSCPTNITCTTP